MDITLENIGNIKKARINLDKNLTVFIGPNNTGKTYASYCIYGLYRNYVNWTTEFIDKIIDLDFQRLYTEGVLEIDLRDVFTIEKINELISICLKDFKDYLPQLFGIEKSFFSNSSIGINVGQDNPNLLNTFLREFEFPLTRSGFAGASIVYQKEKHSSILKLLLEKREDHSARHPRVEREDLMTRILKRYIVDFTFRPYISVNIGSHFIPAERIGISVFSKDLLINRFTKTNELLLDDKNGIGQFNELNFYSVVVQDALQSYEEFTRKSFSLDETFENLAIELEERILKGKLIIKEDGEVYYQTPDNTIRLQASGSIVKSLASLVLYLKNLNFQHNLLIIDEPEINLHPDNQRIVARILAKLSNLGIRIVISTHSDYFIKELNNLMMLGKEHKESNNLREKYGYSNSEVLDYKKVGAYLFINKEVREIEVTEKGMEAATIDEQINQLNSSANDIYWTLFEEE